MKNIFRAALVCLTILLLISVTGCDNSVESDKNINTGELEVTVFTPGYNGSLPGLIKGAKVLIKGIDSVFNTDAYGKVYLNSIVTGTHEVIAFYEATGSAFERVKVEAGALAKIALTLSPSVLYEPKIQFMDIGSYYDYQSVEDTLVFTLKVTDNITSSEKIEVEIIDSYDGKLFKGYPSSSGEINLKFFSKKKGIHVLKVTAKDSDGYIGRDSLVIRYTRPPKVIVNAAVVNGGVQLNWTKCNDSSFVCYEIYQGNSDMYFALLKQINNPDSLIFLDQAPPIIDSVFYKIVTNNREGLRSESNIVKVCNPCGAIYNYTLKNAVIHPSLPYLYFTTNDNRLVMLNYETETIVKAISLNSSPQLMVIGDNGLGIELYVPDESGMLSIYDPVNLDKIFSINCYSKVTSVAIDGKKHIIVGVSSLVILSEPVMCYDRITGNYISGAGTLYAPIIKIFPDKKKIMAAAYDKYNSNPVLEYYEIGDDGKFTLTKTPSIQNFSGMLPSLFNISPDGKYAVTGREGVILNQAYLFNYAKKLGGLGNAFEDYAFDMLGEKIYAAHTSINKILLYRYETGQILTSYYTKQYPFRIFLKGSKLVVISKANAEYSNFTKFIVETVDVGSKN